MKAQKKLHQKLIQIALSTATLFSTTVVPMVNGLTPAAEAATVNAKRADSFVDSMCVNTHLRYLDTVYSNYAGVKQKLVELGIRHIRDGGTSNDWIAKVKDLSTQGIKTTILVDPHHLSLAPNSSYWTSGSPTYITDFVKKVGTNVIDAVEGLNEIDLNYGNYYWRRGDQQKLSNEPNSSLYWGKYTQSITKDTWNALKNDPATAKVKVIGPSLARWYEYNSPNPVGDISPYVDWGSFHPYPHGGNPTDGYFSYDTLKYYYLHGNFPSVNIDEYPHSLVVYSRPSGSKPMAATETGWYTGTDGNRAISESVHAKYIPRLFLEYFRKGIVRTCSYELVDEWKNLGWSEANYGLLRNDLSPKPAYTALKNMIGLLKDPGANFTPGALDYTITVNPPAGYNRTQYVHSVLLQKQNGKFYLALWHEISNNDISKSPAREITPPSMPTTISFKTPISSAIVYSLQKDGSMSSAPFSINNNTISINAEDRVKIIELAAQPQPVNAQPQQVTAYRDSNFAGTSQSFSIGTYLAYKGQLSTVGNDQISSLRVPTGLKARVCENEDGGLCRDYGPGEYSSVGNDLNDKISFIDVRPQ